MRYDGLYTVNYRICVADKGGGLFCGRKLQRSASFESAHNRDRADCGGVRHQYAGIFRQRHSGNAGDNDLAVSNVLGSNIFNLLVVLGCCALVNPVQAKWSLLKKEFPFSIFVTVILLLLDSDFSITKVLSGGGQFVLGRWGGMLFLVLFLIFLYATVKEALTARDRQEADDADEYKALSPLKSGMYIGCGLAGIILGGNLVVDSASTIAVRFGLSQTFIGLTIVALGTSLPELVTSVVAAGKGRMIWR